jgi:hypothetical protein
MLTGTGKDELGERRGRRTLVASVCLSRRLWLSRTGGSYTRARHKPPLIFSADLDKLGKGVQLT